MIPPGATWRLAPAPLRLPDTAALRRLVAYLGIAIGLSPAEAWDTDSVELCLLATEVVEMEKRRRGRG